MCECLMFVQNWNSIIILHLLLLNKSIGFWGLYCKSRDNLVKLQQNIRRNREHFYKTFNSQLITLQLSRFEFDVMGTEQWGYFLLLFTLLLKTWGSLCGGSWVFPERDKRFVSQWWKKFLSACLWAQEWGGCVCIHHGYPLRAKILSVSELQWRCSWLFNSWVI